MSSFHEYVSSCWDQTIVPTLSEYIRVPCQSPDFDPEWETNGLLDAAMKILVDWAEKQDLQGAKFELLRHAGKTPFLYVDVAAFDGEAPLATTAPNAPTVLMYGHMDKQPPLRPWAEGLDPYTPVVRDGKLYGRGGADDGYALCASVLALVALQKQKQPHRRTYIVIEASEESAESHLEYYIALLRPRFGNVSLVMCLDSGALTWDRLWLTVSLRGVLSFQLKVEMLSEGIHSGIAGGAVADTFRIQRVLLDRIEDSATGDVKLDATRCTVPPDVLAQMSAVNDVPAATILESFPLLPGARVTADSSENLDLMLRTWWQPSLTITGADGIPSIANAGNVIRQQTVLNGSLRVPPTVRCKDVVPDLTRVLTSDPPYGATVSMTVDDASDGWSAPALAPWLKDALERASTAAFGKTFASFGMGGSIPFMGMLGDFFPQAQFVITGVLGPKSNAHGPNEFLDIEYAKRVNVCMAEILVAHYSGAPNS